MQDLIIHFGYIGLFLTVFAESGLLIGFFLPGDTLLLTAGVLASQGSFNLWVLLIGLTLMAILGDSTGYFLGYKYGRKIIAKENSMLAKSDYLKKSEVFFKKWGSWAIVLARFVPVVRTFVPTIAGIAKMPYKTFLLFNVLGGVFWVFSITLVGYFFASNVPDIDKYIVPIILVIVVVSIISSIREIRHVMKK
jgi:membrane-associated protein